MKMLIAIVVSVLSTGAWSAQTSVPASEQAKKQLGSTATTGRKNPTSSPQRAAGSSNMPHRALQEATRLEDRKSATLSKSSKSRHAETKNSDANKR